MIARTLRAAGVDNVTSRGVAVQTVRLSQSEQCSFVHGSQEAAGKD
jgi:hypothetical protein